MTTQKREITIHIYATLDVKEKLRQLAEQNLRSMSAQVVALINDAYEPFKQESEQEREDAEY